jgi:hypothetical protein
MVGPPSSGGAAPLPGATAGSPLRRTALVRPTIVPVLLQGAFTGFAPTDPYVRRFWIPIVGPGAVADLLRLTTAARGGRPLKLPVHTPLLVREGLARRDAPDTVAVRPLVPPLSPPQVRRLPPRLRHGYPIPSTATRDAGDGARADLPAMRI